MTSTWYTDRGIRDWAGAQSLHADLTKDPKQRWLFRGHQCSSWRLQSKLERAVIDRFQCPWSEVQSWEKRLLREFKRHLHRYTDDLPDAEDMLRWWALMQHHGAPTRLLDFTYSFHVALFFALEEAGGNQGAAIWAVDHDWCWCGAPQKLVHL